MLLPLAEVARSVAGGYAAAGPRRPDLLPMIVLGQALPVDARTYPCAALWRGGRDARAQRQLCRHAAVTGEGRLPMRVGIVGGGAAGTGGRLRAWRRQGHRGIGRARAGALHRRPRLYLRCQGSPQLERGISPPGSPAIPTSSTLVEEIGLGHRVSGGCRRPRSAPWLRWARSTPS